MIPVSSFFTKTGPHARRWSNTSRLRISRVFTRVWMSCWRNRWSFHFGRESNRRAMPGNADLPIGDAIQENGVPGKESRFAPGGESSYMEAVILIGIQGSGKSTFYRERFFDTHVRVSLDLLKTRA